MGLTLEEFRKEFTEYMLFKELPKPSWNIAPTNDVVILVEDRKQPGTKRAEPARWSLTPPWSPTLTLPYPTFNARSESLTEKRTWKGPLASRRCAIVTTGFYEWSGPKGNRQPHFISSGASTLLMAGLYEWWRAPEAPEEWVLTTTMLTQPSTGIMQGIHDRMPVFLGPTMLDDWIDAGARGDQALVDTATRKSAEIACHLTEHVVAPLRGDGPDLILPISSDSV